MPGDSGFLARRHQSGESENQRSTGKIPELSKKSDNTLTLKVRVRAQLSQLYGGTVHLGWFVHKAS